MNGPRLLLVAVVIVSSFSLVISCISLANNQINEPVGRISSISQPNGSYNGLKNINNPFNDPYFDRQWALQCMPLTSMETTNDQVIVAVLDTGIDVNHEDLTNKIIESIDFSSSHSINDLNGHGTHIAGIIAAERNNGIGIAGVASNVKLLNVKVAEDNGMVWASSVARGIIWATDRGAQIINLSLAVPSNLSTLKEAVNYALDHGVVLVAAAGNFKGTTYPASYDNVISVAAVTPDDMVWSESNDMNFITAYAPGVAILSTIPGNKYEFMSGTSMASAYVSAAASQILNQTSDSNNNGRINDEVLSQLKMLFPKP